jgi:hypothetical protein
MPGSDASQFTRFKKANATQRGDTQQSDSKSVNRLTQYVPRLSGASGVGKFLSSLTKSSSADSSIQGNIVTITASDVSNASITFTVQVGKTYFRNDSGQDLCITFGRLFFTLNADETMLVFEVEPSNSAIGSSESFDITVGACSGGACVVS